MKSEVLRRAIGGVDEDLIEGADLKPEKNRQNNVWAIVVPIAAAAAIVLASVIVLPEKTMPPGSESETETITVTTEAPTESQSTEGPM